MIPAAYEWSIAFRYLRARRQDGFISVIAGFSLVGICLGVATLIIVMSVMNGFRQELMDKILGFNGHAHLYGYSSVLEDYDAVADRIMAIDGVREATPLVDGQAMATLRGNASGVLVRGVDTELLRAQGLFDGRVKSGRIEDYGAPNTIAIGAGLARRIGATAGDRITLISPKGTSTPFGTAPRMQAFRVALTFEVGIYDYDTAFVIMPLEDAQIYFRLPETAVTGVEIKLYDPEQVAELYPALAAIAEGRGVVTDWRSSNAALVSALEVERNVMFLILSLIILIAAFNIVSSLIILVKDKSKDIAVLRTMGATRGGVMRVFMIAGTCIGAAGTFIGFALGLLIASNIDNIRLFLEEKFDTELWNAQIRFLTSVPSEVHLGEVLMTGGVALALSFLATIPPAWRASRLDPVAVLRSE